MENLNYIDLAIIIIIGISSIIAFFRGLITEVLSIAVWFVAFYATTLFAPQVSEYLSSYLDDPFRSLIAFGSTFLGCLFVGGIINIIVTLLIRRLKISAPDRLLGIAFGFMRGVFIVALLVMLLSPTPISHMKIWQEATLIPTVSSISDGLKAMVPDDLMEKMNTKDLLDPSVMSSEALKIPLSDSELEKQAEPVAPPEIPENPQTSQ